MDVAHLAATRIQCLVRRRLAVRRAANALKLVVRSHWGPSDIGLCEMVLDTTRSAFAVVLISAEHPSTGKGHVVMALADLVGAVAKLGTDDADARVEFDQGDGRAQSNVELVRAAARESDSESMIVESLRLSFLQAAAHVPKMLCLRPPNLSLVSPHEACKYTTRILQNDAAIRIQAAQRAYAARARVAVMKWRQFARRDSDALRASSLGSTSKLFSSTPGAEDGLGGDLEVCFESDQEYSLANEVETKFSQEVLDEKKRRASLSNIRSKWSRHRHAGDRPRTTNHSPRHHGEQRFAPEEGQVPSPITEVRYFMDETTNQLVTLHPETPKRPWSSNSKKRSRKCFRWVGESVMVDERGGWLRLWDHNREQWGDYRELLEDTENGHFHCAQLQFPNDDTLQVSSRSKYVVVK